MTGGAASSRKGDRRERQLVNALDDDGWAVIRVPSSGSATDRDLPDVFAMREHPDEPFGSIAIAAEVKANADQYVSLDADEVEGLERFATRAGPACLPAVITHPNRDRFHVFPTATLNETGTGYSVTQAMYPGHELDGIVGLQAGGSNE